MQWKLHKYTGTWKDKYFPAEFLIHINTLPRTWWVPLRQYDNTKSNVISILSQCLCVHFTLLTQLFQILPIFKALACSWISGLVWTSFWSCQSRFILVLLGQFLAFWGNGTEGWNSFALLCTPGTTYLSFIQFPLQQNNNNLKNTSIDLLLTRVLVLYIEIKTWKGCITASMCSVWRGGCDLNLLSELWFQSFISSVLSSEDVSIFRG